MAALLLLKLPLGADAESVDPQNSIAVAPKPAPANQNDLAPAFSKPTPVSIADLRSMEERVKAVVTQVSPAVVAVEVGLSSGSGVIITADGLVLTAGHVCGRPGRDVRFTFPDGKTAWGKTIGVGRDTDTGLMRITRLGPWPHVPLGELEHAGIGDWTLALGHPGGFDLKRSLVVRLGRIIRLDEDVVQTDCPISPGDSGGPLIDMYGRVIAIHSAISISPAENYHVPITDFFTAWDQLAAAERNTRTPSRPAASIGARVAETAGGCRLTQVEPNGAASKAGLKIGDVILQVEGRDILVAASFRRWVAEARPGETLSLEIRRDGKRMSRNVTLEAVPPAP